MAGSKGQSANELLIIYMFIMLIFTVFVAGFAQQRSLEVQEAKMSLADSIGEQFAYEFNLAVRGGDGYLRKIVYPVRLDGVTPYNITLNNISNSIDIQFSIGSINYSHSFPVIRTKVIVNPPIRAILPSGAAYGYVLHSSNFSFSRGEAYIQNMNGIIFISPVTYSSPVAQDMNLSVYPNEIWIWMNTSNITATVSDQLGNPVKDGTLVHFQTTLGTIDDFVPTTNGTAKTVLTSGFDTGVATVTASVSGVIKHAKVSFVGT